MNKLNYRSLALKIFFLAGLLGGAACAENVSSVSTDLRGGKVVTLIINSEEGRSTEQYADWSHYLNEFAISAGDDYRFYKLDTKKLSQLVENSGAFTQPYSMIFMKHGEPSFFYKGPIVEPQVYEFIRLTYSGKAIPKHLKQFAPKETIIRLRNDK